jgi:hypothetical protein
MPDAWAAGPRIFPATPAHYTVVDATIVRDSSLRSAACFQPCFLRALLTSLPYPVLSPRSDSGRLTHASFYVRTAHGGRAPDGPLPPLALCESPCPRAPRAWDCSPMIRSVLDGHSLDLDLRGGRGRMTPTQAGRSQVLHGPGSHATTVRSQSRWGNVTVPHARLHTPRSSCHPVSMKCPRATAGHPGASGHGARLSEFWNYCADTSSSVSCAGTRCRPA